MNKHAAHRDMIACLVSPFLSSLHVRPPTPSTGWLLSFPLLLSILIFTIYTKPHSFKTSPHQESLNIFLAIKSKPFEFHAISKTMMIISWVQGDGLVGRELAAQAWRPEFKFLESISTMDTGWFVTSRRWETETGNPQEPEDQFTLSMQLWTRRPCLK